MSARWGTQRVSAALVLVSVLAGCSDGPAEERGAPLTAGSGAPVIVPGEPGGGGRTATPGERLGDSGARTSAADITFAESMIPHHRQALEMAALAPARSADRRLLALAERVTVAQGPEIQALAGWLRGEGRAVPAGHGHTRGGMYGMATLEQMNRLRVARGTAFDRLFLQLMITHHQGAMTMAKAQLDSGTDRRMRLMARDVISGQTIEISRMRRLLGPAAP
ncbi:DUF305 domain-containing protein [Spongiactinospora rosea]|uniref:DUF305 domain-containing protein n=1 Tax=Spongiactinospora rosea TaxID=2248750 RepID=A0A366M0L3_9ACTN|nr:DUF305 domain-containing protein [Spongiactinospora rosea]RBQ19159.1 DUF305 domain-containing protein [Spongiactinospora rosea]